VVAVAAALALSAGGQATNTGFTTLDVAGEAVTIYRDDFGRPHIFAEADRGLFEAYGYTVAQDRLWQLELNRRAARGRLSEIFGSATLSSDIAARTVGYTDAELDAQFAKLKPAEQATFAAYAAGINRYLSEVVAADPLKLPFEFHALALTPAPWTIRDSVAFGAFMARRFGEIGGRELTNASLLQSLVAAHGPAAGYEIFNDVRWINDPDSPVTVPRTEAFGKRQKPAFQPAQLAGAGAAETAFEAAEARRTWEAYGIPSKLGSYAWVVSPARSAEGYAMLYGGPQMGFSVPEVLHEVQLKGGSGWNVTGMAFAGVPAVLIGRNEHVAWTSTTATGDNVDHYVETLCGAGAGYVHNGACTPFQSRTETIAVRGAAPVSMTVLRSVHGPIVASGPGVVFAQKRAHWGRELESVEAFFGFDLARNINEFEAAARDVVTSHNFLYVDKAGNIAYWQTGQVPIRPSGFDARLPLPGDGSAEWPGGTLPIPESVNPEQGYLANWNNKPSIGWDSYDGVKWGSVQRVALLQDRMHELLDGKGEAELSDIVDVIRDAATRDTRGVYLGPTMLQWTAQGKGDERTDQALKLVGDWVAAGAHRFNLDRDENMDDGAALAIFDEWYKQVVHLVFDDEIGPEGYDLIAPMGAPITDYSPESGSSFWFDFSAYLSNLFSGGSADFARDYCDNMSTKPKESCKTLVADGLKKALDALAADQGQDMSKWTTPAENIEWSNLGGGSLDPIPWQNRGTHNHVVEILSDAK
jgi:penicillin amidase